MKLYGETLELRGVERKISAKSGKDYLIFYFEEATGRPVNFVSRDVNVYSPDMKKGDMLRPAFELNKYGNLDLVGLEVQ